MLKERKTSLEYEINQSRLEPRTLRDVGKAVAKLDKVILSANPSEKRRLLRNVIKTIKVHSHSHIEPYYRIPEFRIMSGIAPRTPLQVCFRKSTQGAELQTSCYVSVRIQAQDYGPFLDPSSCLSLCNSLFPRYSPRSVLKPKRLTGADTAAATQKAMCHSPTGLWSKEPSDRVRKSGNSPQRVVLISRSQNR